MSNCSSLLPGISMMATRLRLAANALAPIATTAPAAMIEIVCTRWDMIILPGEAAPVGRPRIVGCFEPRQSRSDYLKRHSERDACSGPDDSNREGSPEAVGRGR